MVSTLICSWNLGDLNSFSDKLCDNEKSSSENCSVFEEIYSETKPVVVSNDHIVIPNILHQSDETEDFLSKLLGDVNKVDSGDDDSEEIFNSHLNRNINADLNRKNIVDKVFERYDDPYAKFPVSRTPKTPAPHHNSKELYPSPHNTPATKSWRYITIEEREARRKAALEGQRDFCEILIKKGIDPEEYVSSMFKTTRGTESCKKFKFECSTPKTETFSECVSTPLVDRSNINTPISGIKRLPYFSGETNATPNYLNLSVTSRHTDISLNETFSPVHDLPPEIKSTLLSGIICYVDVRTNNEDVSSSIQAELLTLGAKVEKNFTKKVTHVVFKEGRVSTYLKAKKESLPLVSVLWIEACKRARGVVDPAQYPPKRLEKYESIMPYQTIKKRRLKFFNPDSKIRKKVLENFNDPSFVPTLNGKKLDQIKKAATVCKDKITDSSEEKENKGIRKYCTKKLFFDKCEELFSHENKELDKETVLIQRNVNQEGLLDDTSFDSMPDIKSAVLRRKSAPAKLILNKKCGKEKVIKESKIIDDIVSISIDSDTSKGIIENSNEKNKSRAGKSKIKKKEIEVKANEEVGPPNPPKKKRKLYDPSEVYVSIDESEVTQEPTETSIKKPRTRATAGRQLVKLALVRKRGTNRIKTEPDEDDNGSPLSTFVSDGSPTRILRNKKHREIRSVVFTSVHRSELPKYVEMVKKLGKFVVENEVTKKTTHVVCNGPRRTLNLIKGIARGCWIVDMKWLEESVVNEKWLPEDSYIMSDNYPCITDCCRERRGLKTSHVIEIFKDIGSIYVSKAACPPKKDLDQLLKVCCATFSKSSTSADIKVGGHKPNPNPSGVWVSEKWIIDSITLNSLRPFSPYIINAERTQKTKESDSSQE